MRSRRRGKDDQPTEKEEDDDVATWWWAASKSQIERMARIEEKENLDAAIDGRKYKKVKDKKEK